MYCKFRNDKTTLCYHYRYQGATLYNTFATEVHFSKSYRCIRPTHPSRCAIWFQYQISKPVVCFSEQHQTPYLHCTEQDNTAPQVIPKQSLSIVLILIYFTETQGLRWSCLRVLIIPHTTLACCVVWPECIHMHI